jgi:hypothetical protein
VIKLILKLAVAALIANAAYRVGTAYLSYYKFKDAVRETMTFNAEKGDAQLRARILELAGEYDVPLDEDGFTIQHAENHTIVDAGFVRPVDVLPGYTYQWPFTVHVDTFDVNGVPTSRVP